MRNLAVSFSTVLVLCLASTAQQTSPLGRHVSARMPVQGANHELSAQRPAVPSEVTRNAPVPAASNSWQLLATLPGAVIHDIAFSSLTVGYAVAEHGQVWKTTDGGKNWSEVLASDYNDYFYGVSIINSKNVIVSGFYDSTAGSYSVIRWTHDGGKTWSSDIMLTNDTLLRVRFANSKDGIVLGLAGGNAPTVAETTSSGGTTASAWNSVVANPDGGWFGQQFSLLTNLHARASGINFCTSLNGGAQWSCGPMIDSVFDGPVFFLNDTVGWVGGGEIYPNVEGWVHGTTNGGKTWSGRTLDGPWPIRQLLFVDAKTGWAAGGNIYTGVGGIYFTSDGGKTWSVDATTGAEMDACARRSTKPGYQVWCAGYDSSFNGYIYSTHIN